MPFGDMPIPAPPATERRRARHERRVERLAEVAEICVDLARMIHKQAAEANWLGADGPMMAERILLSVRRTTALEAHLDEDFDQREARLAARPVPPTREASAQPAREVVAPPGQVVPAPEGAELSQRKRQIARPIEDAIERDADPRDRERLLCDLHERLEDPLIGLKLGKRPLAVVVAEICAELGISIDLRLFSDEEPRADQAPLDTAIRPAVEPPPLRPPPPVPAITTGRLGGISVGDLVLGAASPGLPDTAFRAGRGPP